MDVNKSMKLIFILPTMIIMSFISPSFSKDIKMTCKHSFQGNYSGGAVLLKYQSNSYSSDKAYILGNNEWIEICTDVNTHGTVSVENFIVNCSIYLANWMNNRRKDFVWNFKTKELHIQTLSKLLNPNTNKKEWKWMYSIGQIGSKNWEVKSGWESEGIKYKKRKCK